MARILRSTVAMLFLLPFVVGVAPANAVAGDLDPSFGSTGIVQIPFSNGVDLATAVAIQPDGKIVVIGTAGPASNPRPAVARLLSNGTLDPTFGSGGLAFLPAGSSAVDGALAPDGRVVVMAHGWGYNLAWGYNVVYRLSPSGALDASFGYGGAAYPPYDPYAPTNGCVDGDGCWGYESSGARPGQLAVAPDGSVVVAQYVHYEPVRYPCDGGCPPDYGGAVAPLPVSQGMVGRLTATGARDASFSPPSGLSAADMAIQADGKIVLATAGFAFTRLEPDGAWDFSHSSQGAAADFGPPYRNPTLHAIAIQPDGAILAAGSVDGILNQDFALARWTSWGAHDPAFGEPLRGSGTMVADSGNPDAAWAVAPQANGKVVVAGQSGSQVGLARFTPSGRLDPNFGMSGFVQTPIAPYGARGLATDSIGRLVVLAQTNGRVAVLRYLSQALPVQCSIPGTAGADVLIGGPGSDTICGFGGSDVLIGGGGSDTLLGGDGKDVLIGLEVPKAVDTLDGGSGIDLCVGDLRDVVVQCP